MKHPVSFRTRSVLVTFVLLGASGCGSETADPTPLESQPVADAEVIARPQPDAGGGGTPSEADAEVAEVPDAAPPAPEPVGVPVLGAGRHVRESVRFETLANHADGLTLPRALAFNPERPGELWVVSQRDDSVVIVSGTDTAEVTTEKRIDPFAMHFMDSPSSIAFGAPATFATCQESRNTYNDQAPANDFMGPTLWSSDLDIFARSNPAAERQIGEDLGSHLDMLHESPLCMGIAWQSDNAYWTFDGLSGSISRYDFEHDHGVGFDDHSDGVIERFATGEVSRVDGVPSHLAYDPESALLYIADTGNARIAVLDTTSGRQVDRLPTVEPGTTLTEMDGADLRTLVDAEAGELSLPSGLVLHDGLLFVGDNETGRITAFTLTGERVDWLETTIAPGRLMGMAFDATGRLYVLDAGANRLVRISAEP